MVDSVLIIAPPKSESILDADLPGVIMGELLLLVLDVVDDMFMSI